MPQKHGAHFSTSPAGGWIVTAQPFGSCAALRACVVRIEDSGWPLSYLYSFFHLRRVPKRNYRRLSLPRDPFGPTSTMVPTPAQRGADFPSTTAIGPGAPPSSVTATE